MFIALVQSRRGGKLADDPTLFSGAFWSGARGVELGLVDEVGELRAYLRGRFGEDVRLQPIEGKRGWLGRFGGGRGAGAARPVSGAFVAELAGEALGAVEERALWNRFGL